MAIGMLKAAEAEAGAESVSQKVLAMAFTDGMVWTPAVGWRGGGALAHEGLSALATDKELEDASDDAAALKALATRRAQLRQWVEVVPRAFDPPSDALLKLLADVGRNWVASSQPVGTRVAIGGEKVMATVSAAATSHPATTKAALYDVFAFLDRAAKRRKRAR